MKKKKVLVIGNGFDLAVGRKTTYKSFYESKFCPKTYPAPFIKFLSNNSNTNLDCIGWYDVENKMQKYAERATDLLPINSEDYFTEAQFRLIKIDLGIESCGNWRAADSVRKELERIGVYMGNNINTSEYPYLTSDIIKKSKLERDQEAKNLIEEKFCEYLKDLNLDPIKAIPANSAVKLLKSYLDDDGASVYSFNYTNVGKLITDDASKASEYDKKIQFMHGALKDESVIFGAKDGFYKDYDFMQKSFHTKFHVPPLVLDMLNADIVEIYGHSLGDCDSQYFEPFFKKQTETGAKRKKIRIYTRNDFDKYKIRKNLQILTDKHYSYLESINDFKIITSE